MRVLPARHMNGVLVCTHGYGTGIMSRDDTHRVSDYWREMIALINPCQVVPFCP